MEMIPHFTNRDKESMQFLADDFIRAIKKEINDLKTENAANIDAFSQGSWVSRLL
jgi:hypothetical protein